MATVSYLTFANPEVEFAYNRAQFDLAVDALERARVHLTNVYSRANRNSLEFLYAQRKHERAVVDMMDARDALRALRM